MYTQVSRKTQLYTDIDRYINKNMKSHRAEVKYKKIEREKEREGERSRVDRKGKKRITEKKIGTQKEGYGGRQ